MEMVQIINNISTDYINNINCYQQNQQKCIENTKYIGKSDKDYVVSNKGELFHTYFKEFRSSIKGDFLDTDKRLEDLSYKYKDLCDEIKNEGLNEDKENEKLQSMNHVFKMMTNMVVSQQAFIAKSNEIHDHLVAELHKDIINNPDKAKHNNILENHEKVMKTLNQLENNLLTYANIYYESFINKIKTNLVDESIYTSLTVMKNYNLLPTSYYDTRNTIDNIYEEIKNL